MALTKIPRGLLDTGIADSSDATAITIDSSENVAIPKLLTLNNPASVQAKFNPNNDSFAALAEFYNGTSSSNPFVVGQGYASGTDNIAYVWNRANQPLLLGTNNTERMRIDSSGNVSIGNSSVAFPSGEGLQVYSSGNPRIKLANSTTGVASGDGTQFYLDGPDVIYDNKDAGNQRWYTGGAERMRMDSSGNVGIGTNSPAYPLEVKLDQSADWLSRFYNEGTTEGDLGVLIRTGSEHDGTSILSLYSGSSYKFKFQADGKLGVGTTSPDAKLHIEGNSDTSDEDCMLVIEDLDSTTGSRIPAILFKGNGSTIGRMRVNDSLGFMLSGGSTMSDDLVVKNGPLVGIGTNSPKRMLQVGDNTQAIAALSLQTTTSGLSRIYMGDNDSTSAEYAGLISYAHSSNDMQFWANGGEMFRLQPNVFSFGGGSTSHGRIRQYHYAVALSAGASVALLQNNSGAHTDVNFLYWIEAYHSGRTYRTGVGTFGGYGLNTSSAGQGLNFTITAVSSGIKRLDFVANSSYATTVYIGMLILGDTALTVHNGTLGDMI